MEKFAYNDITFVWQNNVLAISNALLERRIDFTQGLPKTTSLVIDGVQTAGENPAFDFHLTGFPAPGHEQFKTDYKVQNVEFSHLCRPDGDGAKISVKVFESIRQLQLEFHYIVYCNMPLMAVECGVCSAVTPLLYWNPRQSHESFRVFDKVHKVVTICDSLNLCDFSVTGTGVVIEIFSNRIEITNPGIPLIDVARIIDNPPKSRNEKLASFQPKGEEN